MADDTSLMQRLFTRVMLAIGRGRLTAVDDAGAAQAMQVQLGRDEVRDATPRLAEYGLASNPPAGSDVILVFVGGDRSMGAVIATGHKGSRPRNLRPGESALHDDLGQIIHLTRDGIVIRGAGLPITITGAPLIRLETDRLEVTGDIVDRCDEDGRSMQGMRDVYNIHRHGSSPTPTPEQ